MDFRLAVMDDLQQLKNVYKSIIQNMNDSGIEIWDDIYPCEFFKEDIENKQLYIMLDKGEIVFAFVLCGTSAGENEVKWKNDGKKAIYIDRLGVNINRLRKRMGSLAIKKAKEIAVISGAEYLRLFVVDINKPAINLYSKNGFEIAEGVYNEVFDDGFTLHEYGYELKL